MATASSVDLAAPAATTVACPVVLSCSDSQLSMAASVTGILTFVVAIAAGFYFRTLQVRQAPMRRVEMSQRIGVVLGEIHRLDFDLQGLKENLQSDDSELFRQLEYHVETTRGAYFRLEVLLQHDVKERSRLGWRSLRNLGRFVASEAELKQLEAQVDDAASKMRSIHQEVQARVHDRERLQQNRLLIMIFEKLTELESRLDTAQGRGGSSPESSGDRLQRAPLPPYKDILSSMMRPRKQNTDLSVFRGANPPEQGGEPKEEQGAIEPKRHNTA